MAADKYTKVLVEFPNWMLDTLNDEAERLGVARNAVIMMLLDQKLKEMGYQQPERRKK